MNLSVTLSDTSVNGMYGDIEFINGTATFVLKHGESKTAYGLPAGIQYQVTEQAVEGYTLNAVGDTGTVPADGTAVAGIYQYKRQRYYHRYSRFT